MRGGDSGREDSGRESGFTGFKTDKTAMKKALETLFEAGFYPQNPRPEVVGDKELENTLKTVTPPDTIRPKASEFAACKDCFIATFENIIMEKKEREHLHWFTFLGELLVHWGLGNKDAPNGGKDWVYNEIFVQYFQKEFFITDEMSLDCTTHSLATIACDCPKAKEYVKHFLSIMDANHGPQFRQSLEALMPTLEAEGVTLELSGEKLKATEIPV
jgi:hypothetical protein